MKHNIMKIAMLFLGFGLLVTSCEIDPIDPIGGGGDPTISVTGTPSGEITAGDSFTIGVTASPADDALKTIDITEDGTLVNFGRLTINGAAATANPILLFGDDKNGLSYQIAIVAHSDASTKEYSVNVIDDANYQANFGFDVTTSITLPGLEVTSSSSIDVPVAALIGLPIKMTMGSLDLASIAVYEADELITDLSRLYYDDLSTTFDGNPYLLPSADEDGAERTLYLRVQNVADTRNYSIVLADADGNSASFDLAVTTGTPVTEITGVLLNAAGPTGTGGLDLDLGEGTGSANTAAEIRDEGINLDLPAATNWRRSISGVNGSVIKQLKPGENGLSETFGYEGVIASETIATVFDSGEAFTATNTGGDLISAVVNEGDMFVVQNGENYY